MPTIFLVEDNAADVDLFRMVLRDACIDCNLVVFDDGREIIDHIRKPDPALDGSVPDLIMLDLNLPKNDGLEILQVIRDVPAFANVSIAVLSSSSSPRERAQLSAFDIRQFIAKPADLQAYLDIGATVRNLLDADKSQPRAPSTTITRQAPE